MSRIKDAIMDVQIEMEEKLGRPVTFDEAQDELAERLKFKAWLREHEIEARALYNDYRRDVDYVPVEPDTFEVYARELFKRGVL